MLLPDAMPAPERVLVTGASGFIGCHVLERLARAGLEIHAVSRTHSPGEDTGVRWWSADVANGEAVRNVVSSVEPHVVLNLAGETRAARQVELVRPTFDTNLAGTVNILLAAAETGCRRVVLTGSLEEPEPGSYAAPSSPYAASKWAGYAYGRMFNEVFGVPVVGLRLFMVYGPGQRDLGKLVPYTITSLLRGETPRLSSGNREIDWVYVGDVADAYLAAARAEGIDGETVDIGSGELVSVRGIVQRLTRLIAPDIEPEFGALEDREREQVRRADTSAAARIGWRVSTELDEGLRETVSWYRKRQREGTPSPSW